MQWADKELLCLYMGTWQVCKARANEYPTPEAVLDDHARCGRQALFVARSAVIPTLMLLNGRRPTLTELSEGYRDDPPW